MEGLASRVAELRKLEDQYRQE
ncbi:hypothetical protein KIPB_016207, partial [Kipferlia bialata]|eukprot:g16207.t1